MQIKNIVLSEEGLLETQWAIEATRLDVIQCGMGRGSKYLFQGKNIADLVDPERNKPWRDMKGNWAQKDLAGNNDRIVWSSVPHKTSRNGGVAQHGFPDLGYLIHCNEELDAIGVPKAENI